MKTEGIVKAVKKKAERRLNVFVYPAEGGAPYVAEVEPDEEGVFTLENSMDYKVQRGSVCEYKGNLWAVVNEANPLTVNVHTLTGEGHMHPQVLHGIAKNNLWLQLTEIARRRNPWRSAGTWGLMALGVVLILVLAWQVKSTGDGFEQLKEAINGISLRASGSGHQSISPGG